MVSTSSAPEDSKEWTLVSLPKTERKKEKKSTDHWNGTLNTVDYLSLIKTRHQQDQPSKSGPQMLMSIDEQSNKHSQTPNILRSQGYAAPVAESPCSYGVHPNPLRWNIMLFICG